METQLDILWVLISAALVLFMQLGFCMLESGLVRSKNTINVAAKNLCDLCTAVVLYWAIGFGLMYGASAGGVIGSSGFFHSVTDNPADTAFFFFQMVFCATAATIIAGAVAERMRFGGYLIITVGVTAFFYPVAGHWIWADEGFLYRLGFVDFAGSTAVHSVGGWLALAAVIVLGPRTGRFSSNRPLASGHSLVFATFGVLVLWLGWIGFNGGSTYAFSAEVPVIVFHTSLAGAVGGLTGLALAIALRRVYDLKDFLNGVIAGLVAITASADVATTFAAALIGLGGGTICYYSTRLLERFKVDDVVGACPAHAVAGALGTLAVAFVLPAEALPEGGRLAQLGIQALGVGLVFAWAFGLGLVFLKAINKIYPLRVSAEAERLGLNIVEHGASTEINDLLTQMTEHRDQGDFSTVVESDPYTEVGQIAGEYNRVLQKAAEEMLQREQLADRLREEKGLSEAMHANLLSSIAYAERIQNALFPDPAAMDLRLADWFHWLEPRDGVSGDFVWLHQNGGRLLIAVVDCTGHGVPGALMSIIGHSLLNQIVLESKIEMPDEILEELHRRVRRSLNQDSADADASDGMDVCLVRLDRQGILFAGARRPLFVARPGDCKDPLNYEVEVIRGDRKSIGGRQRETARRFNNHEVHLPSGSVLYLTTDGLVEQTDPNGVLYDNQRLRELIKSCAGEALDLQRDKFIESLTSFQQSADRKDDIAVFALRI